jgi:hypothetical protein
MKVRFVILAATIATNLCLLILPLFAGSTGHDFQITNPRPNAVVPGEVIEVSGVGADPGGTVELEVLTNDWYLQDGKARVNADGSWTYSPVHLAGKGVFNNHTLKATIVKDGHRGQSVTVSGLVRKQ